MAGHMEFKGPIYVVSMDNIPVRAYTEQDDAVTFWNEHQSEQDKLNGTPKGSVKPCELWGPTAGHF